jgi:hypothetical protein
MRQSAEAPQIGTTASGLPLSAADELELDVAALRTRERSLLPHVLLLWATPAIWPLLSQYVEAYGKGLLMTSRPDVDLM